MQPRRTFRNYKHVVFPTYFITKKKENTTAKSTNKQTNNKYKHVKTASIQWYKIFGKRVDQFKHILVLRTSNQKSFYDYPIDFIHIMFIYCTEWLFYNVYQYPDVFTSVPVSGCWKLSGFLQCNFTAVTWPFYEYFLPLPSMAK
jgi:hypothetical protein